MHLMQPNKNGKIPNLTTETLVKKKEIYGNPIVHL